MAKSSSSQCDWPLCWKEFFLHQQGLRSRKEPLECSRVEWGPTMWCPSYHPWRKQGPPCLLLLTKHKKTAPRQAQPHRSSNPGTNLAHRMQKKCILKHSKHITKTVTMLLLLAFFFKRHPPLSLYYPTPLCHCSGVPKAPHMLPAPAPHKHNSIPAGWSKPAHKQAPFIMQLSKPSQGQLSFTTTSPARLCCGQEPEPYHAPWPDGRAAPRSTHLF